MIAEIIYRIVILLLLGSCVGILSFKEVLYFKRLKLFKEKYRPGFNIFVILLDIFAFVLNVISLIDTIS